MDDDQLEVGGKSTSNVLADTTEHKSEAVGKRKLSSVAEGTEVDTKRNKPYNGRIVDVSAAPVIKTEPRDVDDKPSTSSYNAHTAKIEICSDDDEKELTTEDAERQSDETIKADPDQSNNMQQSPPNSSVSIAIKTEQESTKEDADQNRDAIGDPTDEVGSNARAPSAIAKAEPSSVGDTTTKADPDQSNNMQQSPPDFNVSSSTMRPSCRFGIRCYRRSAHRNEEAHPGDPDYRRPVYPAPPLGTPACTFGNICYRRNPFHFQQYSHPPDFDSDQNIRNRLRQRRALKKNSNDLTAHSESEEDPFSSDNDVEYNPDADDSHDDDQEELEFESQRINCDAFD